MRKKKEYFTEETCTIKEVPKGMPFKLVDSKGKVGKKVYFKGEYDRSEKKYLCDDAQDMWDLVNMLSLSKKFLQGLNIDVK